jgi:hypothetical protein
MAAPPRPSAPWHRAVLRSTEYEVCNFIGRESPNLFAAGRGGTACKPNKPDRRHPDIAKFTGVSPLRRHNSGASTPASQTAGSRVQATRLHHDKTCHKTEATCEATNQYQSMWLKHRVQQTEHGVDEARPQHWRDQSAGRWTTRERGKHRAVKYTDKGRYERMKTASGSRP